MSLVQIGIQLVALWGIAGFLHLKKCDYLETRRTLFKYQAWDLWVPFFLITLWMLGKMTISMLLSSLNGKPSLIVLGMLSELLLFLGLLLFYRKMTHQSFAYLGLYRDQWGFRFILGLRWVLGFFFLKNFLGYLMFMIIPEETYNQLVSRVDLKQANILFRYFSFFEDKWGIHTLWFPIVYFNIFKPIFEETIYRGLLYGPIRKKIGPLLAIGITSFLFSLEHGSVEIILIFYGIMFAYIYERTESLLPGILFHALILFDVTFFYFLADPLPYQVFKTNLSLTLILFGILFILIEVIYRRMIKKGYILKLPRVILQQS